MKYKYFSNVLIALLILSSVSVAKEKERFALSQVLQLVRSGNPKINSSREDINISEAEILQKSLRINPQMSLEVEGFGGSKEKSGADNLEAAFAISQVFETAGKREKRVEVASCQSELVKNQYEFLEYEILSEAAICYYELYSLQENNKLLISLEAISKEFLAIVTKRHAAGLDSMLEVTKARIALSKNAIKLKKSQHQLQLQRAMLASFWGSDEPVACELSLESKELPVLPQWDELVNLLEYNPRFSSIEMLKKYAQANLKYQKSLSHGDIELSVGYKTFNEDNSGAFMVGAAVPLPLFDRNQGGRLQAIHSISKVDHEALNLRLEILGELRSAYGNLKSSHMYVATFQDEILEDSEKLLEASQKAYAQGKSDYLEFVDSQRTFYESKQSYIEALADYYKARVEIGRIVGQVHGV